MVGSNTSNSMSFLSPSGVRKRPRNESNWKKKAAKRDRNLGQGYTSASTGKKVAKRKVGPPVTVPVCVMKLLAKIILRSYSQNSGLQAVGIHRQHIYKNKQQFKQSSIGIQIT